MQQWMKKNSCRSGSGRSWPSPWARPRFHDSDKLSMTVILTAMNRFINETHGSKTALTEISLTDCSGSG